MMIKGQFTFICLVWCIILSTVNYSPVNGRSLSQAQADGICHTDILTATPDSNISDVTNIALGLFFSIENTNTAQTADISAFSVYLDTTLDGFNFTISTLDEDREYTTIGAGSMGDDNWVEIANGVDVSLDTDFSLDEDGRSLIPFASFDGSGESVSIPPLGIKSFYMKFSVAVMSVDDDTAISGGDNDIDSSSSVGLMTRVGRKDIFSGTGIIPKDNTELDFFFTPSRFVGKVWSRLETCAPSASPTPAPSYAPSDSPSAMPSEPPTPAPTISPSPPPTKLNSIKVSDNKLVINFVGRSQRQLFNHRSLQECLTQAERNLVQVQLKQQADNTYADVGLEVSYNGIIIKSIEANSDCSKITFFYDQEIVYNTVAGDETTISEIIQMPMDTNAKQQAFINGLTENASPGSKLKTEMYTEEIEVTEQGLSTRMPTSSPSISTAPTDSPSESPSDSPTQRPSISLRPTVSSAPSWSPTAAPSISIKPTISVSPTTQPSMSPTISTAPTQGPSGIPSMQPSISQAPTESPSNVPSFTPSVSPSDVPSNRPSTALNYMTVEYSFDISYPPGEDHTQIKQDIEGNVTESLQDILSDRSDILFPLRQNYGLAFSKEEDANNFVYEQEDAVDCVNEGPEGNVCTRFVIRVYFQHQRGISEGLVTGWLLEVSDRIMGTLQGSYTGDESVRTVQVMVLQDVESYPDDLDAVCEVVEEILANSTVIESSSYSILAVECLGFEFIYEVPGLFKNRHHRGLRSLQELNDASVEFRVTGEYTQANRVDEEVKDLEFDTLLEDSINKDVGKEIGNTLKEREVVAMKGSTEVESITKITTAPTQAPIEQGNLPSVYITESSSNFASGSAGLAVIVTCSLVVALVGGFLFYKGIQRSKMEKDDFYWEEDSFSNYTDDDEAKMYASGHKSMPIQDETSSGTPEEEAVVLPDHYTGAETNIFGSQVGSTRNVDNGDWLDEKMQIHADMTNNDRSKSLRKLNDFDNRLQRKLDQRSGSQGENAEETLNEFDQRMQRKLNGRDGAQRGRSPASRSSSFEEKLQNKLSKNDIELKRRSSSGSGSSFEQRLQRKMSEGSLSGRSPSPSQRNISSSPSSRQLDNFEARIAAKSKGEDMSRSRSPLPGFSFNERMKNKLNEDKRSDSRSSSRQSNDSRASFEERLRAKMNEDSSERGRPSRGTLASSSSESSRQLDDLEKRIAAKQRESNSSRDSSPNNALSYEQRLRRKLSNGSGSSDSSSSRRLDTFEEKIARKSREGSNSRSRPDALTSSRSSPSSRRLNSFEERIAAKSREGNASKSRDSSPMSYNERLERKLSESTRSTSAPRPSLSSTPSSKRLDSFEEKIAAKTRENNRQSTSRGSSPSVTSYEDRLNRKLSEGRSARSSSAPRSTSLSSMNSLDSYEARIAAKTKEGKRSASRDPSPSMSYEDRLNKKLSQSTTSSPRRSKPSSRISSSMNSMDSFEARIAAKSREGDKKSRMSASSSSPSSRDSFEDRIARKSREGASSSMSRTARLSSSMSSTDSFEARIAAKSSQGSTGRSKPRSPSPSMRSSQLDSFESKIQAKLDSQDKKKSRFDEAFAKAQARNTMRDLSSPDSTQQRLEKNARSRSTSPGDSARLLDSFEARIAEKSRQGSRGSSPSVSSANFDERIQQKLEGSVGKRSSSNSKANSKQSYEEKLEAKLAMSRKESK